MSPSSPNTDSISGKERRLIYILQIERVYLPLPLSSCLMSGRVLFVHAIVTVAVASVPIEVCQRPGTDGCSADAFGSVQAALDIAGDGAIVQVSAGVYHSCSFREEDSATSVQIKSSAGCLPGYGICMCVCSLRRDQSDHLLPSIIAACPPRDRNVDASAL